MDHLIERMLQTGCTDIRVVTRPQKTDVIARAEHWGLTVVAAQPRSVSESLLAGLDGTRPDDVILIGFPDTIWEPADGFVRVVDALGAFEVALALFHGRDPQRSDVVELGDAGVVTSIRVKPAAPVSPWIWGFAVARRRALSLLSKYPEPGLALNHMCRRHHVVGVPLSGSFIDIGTREALENYIRDVEG